MIKTFHLFNNTREITIDSPWLDFYKEYIYELEDDYVDVIMNAYCYNNQISDEQIEKAIITTIKEELEMLCDFSTGEFEAFLKRNGEA